MLDTEPSDSQKTFSDSSLGDSATEREADEDKKLRRQSFQLMAEVGNFGLFLAISLIISFVIGRWMDDLFGTKPIFTIFWIVCGIIASVLELRKSLIKAKKLAQDDPSHE